MWQLGRGQSLTVNGFNDPPNAYGASNFGVISGTKIGARSVQLGFKYYF